MKDYMMSGQAVNNDKSKSVMMWKYSIVALLEFLIIMPLGGDFNVWVKLVCMILIGLTIAYWFARVVKRAPKSSEIYIFLAQYTCLILLVTTFLLYSKGLLMTMFTMPRAINVWINFAFYIAGAYIALSPKLLGRVFYWGVSFSVEGWKDIVIKQEVVADHQVEANKGEAKPLSMWKFSIVAYLEFLLGTMVLKVTKDAGLIIVSALLIGFTIAFWFSLTQNRPPTSTEINRFLWPYVGLMTVNWLYILYKNQGFITIEAAYAVMLVFFYAVGAYSSLSEKYMGKIVYRRYLRK
jgi:hypothetical protein